jgi:hypothetical protein
MDITLKLRLSAHSAKNAGKYIYETQTQRSVLLTKEECITVAAQLLADPFESLSHDGVGELVLSLSNHPQQNITLQLTGSAASKLSAYLTSKKPLPPLPPPDPSISTSVYSNAAS